MQTCACLLFFKIPPYGKPTKMLVGGCPQTPETSPVATAARSANAEKTTARGREICTQKHHATLARGMVFLIFPFTWR